MGMEPRGIRDGVFWVGAIDWDRRLFDELIPLPDGTSYNAYLVRGSEGTALIDTVDPSMSHFLMDFLERVDHIDYIIANHAEQDHSGTIPLVLDAFPQAKMVTNPKCKGMLIDLLPIPDEKFITVDDGETLSLGDKTLEFIYAPWVHWPETMFTYLREDKLLFTCDFLGSHLATSDLYATDRERVYEAAKRYYAEIMMPFRTVIKRNLEKIAPLEIEMIAPSHGPIYDDPQFILEAYREWTSDAVKNEVVLPYLSMHGSTKELVDHFVGALIDRGIAVRQFNLTSVDIGKLAMALVDAATLVLAAPTVLVGPHPNAVYAAYLVNALRPKLRFASIIGSFGWGTKMVEQLKGMLSNLKVELIEPVIVKGRPREDDFKALDKLADTILAKHRSLKET